MRLFEIHEAIEALLNASVDRETGEVCEEALAELEALEHARDAKALAVAAYLLGQEAEAEAIEATAKRLAQRAAVHRRHAERLRRYLADHLEPGQTLADDRVAISWRRSQAVVVDDADAVPDDYCAIERRPRRSLIGAALKAGEDLPGAHLEARTHLVVR